VSEGVPQDGVFGSRFAGRRLDGRICDAFMEAMSTSDGDKDQAVTQASPPAPKKPLPPAAQRALAEAAARRVARERNVVPSPAEQGGRKGLDPVRYGDWEVKGIASDF
jgi:hypothetical protein